MPLRIGLNGVGRIGRALMRRLVGRSDLELVAINDLADLDSLVGLLRRDSLLGTFPGEIDSSDGHLIVNGRQIARYQRADITSIPWGERGVELVIEATGLHSEGRSAEGHLGDGVKHVILSSNAPDADITVCYGVNHESVRPDEHRLISNASCTTNCLAVVAAELDRQIGIERALLNTVHCFNNSQPLTDAPHADPRRARAATINMVPTTTGAASAIGIVLPGLADRLDGFAVRVPAAQVSLIDLVAQVKTDVSVETVNDLFRRAAAGKMKGILGVSTGPLVSSDFVGDRHSAVVDEPLTQVVGDRLVRVVAWYDNEVGYASRLADLAAWLGGS